MRWKWVVAAAHQVRAAVCPECPDTPRSVDPETGEMRCPDHGTLLPPDLASDQDSEAP